MRNSRLLFSRCWRSLGRHFPRSSLLKAFSSLMIWSVTLQALKLGGSVPDGVQWDRKKKGK